MNLDGINKKLYKNSISSYTYLFYKFSKSVSIFFYIFMYYLFCYLFIDINLSIFFDILEYLFNNKKVNTDNIIKKNYTSFKFGKNYNFKFKKADYYFRKENITRGYSNIVCWNKNTLSRTKYV